MTTYAYIIRKTEKAIWDSPIGFRADITASDCISNPVWMLDSRFWPNPTSQASRERIEASAKEFVEQLSINPPADIPENENANPRFFWMNDREKGQSEESRRIAIIFADDYILSGPHAGPFRRSYSAFILHLDERQDDYPRRIDPNGFNERYVETNIDALDDDIRDRVTDIVKLARPDLAAQFEETGYALAI